MGEAFPVVVAALDAGNAIDIFSYTGTITFSSSDPNATLPSPYTFVLADEGATGFTIVLRTLGLQTVTVMDASGVLTPATLTMTVTATLSSVGIPTLTAWMQVALALLLGLAGVCASRVSQ